MNKELLRKGGLPLLGLALLLAGAAVLVSPFLSGCGGGAEDEPLVASLSTLRSGVTTGIFELSSGSVDLRITVVNPNARAKTIWYNTTQKYELRIHQGSTLVWEWSNGKTFTGGEVLDLVSAHGTSIYPETWDMRNNGGTLVGTGTYTLTGDILNSPVMGQRVTDPVLITFEIQ